MRGPDSNCVEFTLVKITYNSVEFTFSDTLNGLNNNEFGLYICEGDESLTCMQSGLYSLDSAVSYPYDVGKISGLKPNTLYTLSADAFPTWGIDAYGYITFTTGTAPKLIDLAGLEYFKTKIDANYASKTHTHSYNDLSDLPSTLNITSTQTSLAEVD